MQFIITIFQGLLQPILLLTLLLLAFVLLAKPLLRYLIKRITNDVATTLLSDTYDQNLAELLPSLQRFSVINLIEMSLRAQTGADITRPLGSPKHFFNYDNLMFSPPQMTALSLPVSVKIDMSVTLGSSAAKPLTLKIPLMIAGMAYGLGISEEAKLALAKASKILHTANCSGEGPFLPEEPGQSGKFILQICNWQWGLRTNEQIAAADMLEVKIGQGADVGPAKIEAIDFEGRARILGELAPGEPAVGLPAPPGVNKPEDWPAFMKRLRQRAKGIPIALKIMATDRIEEELAVAVELGFDAIVIDGCEAGSHATPPIKQDDFGIPSLYGLIRARRYLKNSRMSLIISGGYFTPGQCLKALALGADAIYLGTIPLFALGHNQTEKVLPWEPPTTLLYYNSPTKTQLNVEQAATSVVNVLKSMVLEMEEAMRALGKSSLKELSPDDLVALDSVTAEVTGVRQAYSPVASQINSTEKKCRESLAQLNSLLHYARQLTIFLETALAGLCYSNDSACVPELRDQYHLLIKQKQIIPV
ncbi:FMN-binding glutamate synthase family protein [Anaerosporomusa subterranea]|uniref:FMN-binding glutamate synthase family protein n=1 Tax=Anaerosporomusa subterranea TaxID=1794912 RepID=UPI0009EF5D58|nr:FMN-binding glutamate synthase family protein [Anaerosporomusa subterranea]